MSFVHRLGTGAAVALAGVLVLGTAPASADHTLDVGAQGCTAGAISLQVGVTLRTSRVTSTVLADGSTRWSCTFTGLPESTSAEENGYFDWERPDRALRTRVTCSTPQTIGFDGEALFTPGGVLRTTCVEPPA